MNRDEVALKIYLTLLANWDDAGVQGRQDTVAESVDLADRFIEELRLTKVKRPPYADIA